MNEEVQAHYDRYLHNLALAGRMETSLPGDENWVCVVMFYAALHLMTAYLVTKGNVRFDPRSASHPDRKKAMDKCPELKDSRLRYRQLKDLGEQVRYDPGFVFTPNHFKDAQAHLSKIESIVLPKVKRILGL